MRAALTSIALLALGFATPASAQAPLQTCLSFDAVLELASQRDPSVEIALAGEAEADANILDARSLYRPRVDAVGRTGIGSTGVVDSGVSNSLGFRASQRVLDFGDAKYARLSARSEFDAAQNDTQQVRIDAASQAGLSALTYFEADAQLQLTQRRQSYFERQLAATDTLLELGGATRTERAAVASQLADAKGFAEELSFRKERALTQIQIQTDTAQSLCSRDGFPSALLREDATAPQQAIARAVASNANLAALDDRADAEAARAKREARARLPIIDVVATGAYSSTNAFDDFEFRDRIGVDVRVPLYSGNALGARKRRASARERAARARSLDFRRQLTQDVSITWRRIRSLREQLESRREVERQTLLQFEAAELELGAGTKSLRDLVEIRLEYEAAGLERIRTEADIARQQLTLRALTGRLARSPN